MFDCFGVRFVSLFSKKSQTFKMVKKAGKLDKHGHNFIILAKPVDNHGITLVHITYTPLSDGRTVNLKNREEVL